MKTFFLNVILFRTCLISFQSGDKRSADEFGSQDRRACSELRGQTGYPNERGQTANGARVCRASQDTACL